MWLFTAVPAIIWLLVSGLLNGVGEYLSKQWGYSPSWKLAVLVAVAYVTSSLLWLPALLHQNQLSTMGVAWILIALASTLGLGFFVFHEHLTLTQWVGIGFAAIAIYFLIS